MYTYSGRSAQVWWQKNGVGAGRSRNLTVVDLAAEATQALATLAQHGMQMQCFIQDGEIQVLSGAATISNGAINRTGAR